ncbi:hypothetical protein IH086_001179 [Salmonella enterica]|nr:hypothetical protein [Salmonella enterica]
MTINNHPAHGPVSLDRLHQIREILSKAAAQSDGGNLCYAMADAVKVIDGVIASFGAEPVAYMYKDGDDIEYNGHNEFSGGGKGAPLYAAPPAPVMPAELHPDTQNLAANFCTALAEKLYGAQLKYGYDADWKQDGWHTQCLAHFHQHIAKGDPRDVAAYCAFMWYHGWKTESVSGPVVPEERPADISVLMASHSDSLFNDDDAQEIWSARRAAMLQSKYRDLSQPVDPQISEYERIMLRAGWVMVPVEPTDEMIAAAMNCEDVLFNSDESFCVQFGNIYEAMLAAAPQPEISDGK